MFYFLSHLYKHLILKKKKINARQNNKKPAYYNCIYFRSKGREIWKKTKNYFIFIFFGTCYDIYGYSIYVSKIQTEIGFQECNEQVKGR